MKVFIALSCLVAVCLASPSKRLVTGNVAKTIKITADMVSKNEVSKRANSIVQGAFDMTDGNKDGHITAVEFATYYVDEMPMFHLTKEEWIKAFNKALKEIDLNDNGTLEINEYEKLI